MEKKFQVFISSTFKDLKEERQIVLHALLSRGDIIPSGMELFPAKDSQPWAHIENVLKGCDYYLVIVGEHYGSTTDDGISYTQKEYELAKQIGIPILAFPKSATSSLNDELQDFRSTLEASHLCKFWSTKHELVSGILTSLGNTIQEAPGIGWVRSKDIQSEEEVFKLKNRIIDLESQLSHEGPELELFSNGEDEVELIAKVLRRPDRIWKKETFRTTWNELFRSIGPKLFAPQTDLYFNSFIKAFIAKKLGASDVREYTDPANLVKMQMLALKLIREAGRAQQRQGQLSPLWELTSSGKAHVSELIAVKSSD